MFSTIAIIIGLFTAASSAVDMLLSPSQKKYIEDISLKTWFYLDQFKGKSLSFWIDRNLIVKYLLLLIIMLIALLAGFTYGNRDQRFDASFLQTWGMLAAIIGPSCLIGLVVFNWIINAKTPLRAFLRATLCLMLIPMPFWAVIEYAGHYKDRLIPHGQASLEQMLYVIAFVSTTLAVTVILIFWLVVAVPVVLIYVLTLILTVLEFLARKVAETSKGPLVGVGTLIAVIGALAKLL